jgi:PAS domain S-box-containing protein
MDIEDLKRAEERHQRDQPQIRRIIDAIPQQIVVLGPNGETLYVNQAVLDYTDLTLEASQGEAFRVRIFHPDDAARVRDERRRALARGAPFALEQRVLRHDGQYRWFIIRYQPLRGDQGRLLRWYATGTDIDDHKQAEERMRHENLALREEIDHASLFMETNAAQRQRTANELQMTRQPDGLGKRVGKKGEITIIGNVLPNGARIFRERLSQVQDEVWYWETRVGTVDNFRVALFDNDTRILATVMYDGDFKPYIADIFVKAGEWLDRLFGGVVEGYESSSALGTLGLVGKLAVEADLFYVAHSDVSVHDVGKMKRLSKAVSDMLDAAS